jgi:hypothetical protein
MRMKDMPDAAMSTPLVLEEFFSGLIRAEGSFVNVWSRARRGIVIDILPSWDGRVLVLDEHYFYSDGEIDHKVWRLERTTPGVFSGSSVGMVGAGRVWTEGRAVRLRYRLILAGMSFDFDETMVLRDDGSVLGRSTVKKWGLLVGRVELTLRRA